LLYIPYYYYLSHLEAKSTAVLSDSMRHTFI